MANKRISELTPASILTLDDLLVLVNDSQTRKTTIEALIAFLLDQGQFAGLVDGTVPENQLPELTTTIVAEGDNKYFTAARVLSQLLTNFEAQGDEEITDADTLLEALEKAQGQISAREKTANRGIPGGYASLDGSGQVPLGQLPTSVLGAAVYKGAWNASDNIDPIPPASTSNKGWYYVVSEGGNTSINGISEWASGDWIISNGVSWQKVDNTDAGILEFLTGFTELTGTITAGDTVLSALGKAQGQFNLRGAMNGYASLDSTTRVPIGQMPLLPALTFVTTAITTGDTIQAAFGKAQGQLNTKNAAGGYPSLDLTTRIPVAQLSLLPALTLATTAIAASDTIPVAFGKAQGQLNLRAAANGYASLDSAIRIPIAQLPILPALTLSTAAITTGDSIQGAFGKAQGQLNTKGIAFGFASLDGDVRLPSTQLPLLPALTLSTTALASGDTVPVAFGKIQGQLNARESAANKGAVNGYASLDANGLLPKTQLLRGEKALDLDFTGYQIASGTTNVLLYNHQIPAGTFAAGDQLDIDIWYGAESTADIKTYRVYFNTVATLTGTSLKLIGTLQVTTGNSSGKFSREVSFLTDTTAKAGVAAATSSPYGYDTATLDTTAITIPSISAGFYVLIAAQRASILDTVTIQRVALKALYK